MCRLALSAPPRAQAIKFGLIGSTALHWRWAWTPKSLVVRVAIIEAGMASNSTASIVATEHRLDGPLCGLMVGVGIPVSFLTLSLQVAWLAQKPGF